MCLPNILSPVFMFAVIFHCRSFSPCWPLAFLFVSQSLWIFMFFFLQNWSLMFSTTGSSSFFQITSKKTRFRCCFFFLKVLAAMRFFFQIKPWVTFGLPYLLIELFYIGMPVVQTDGRSVYGHEITKFSPMGSLPLFFTHGAPLSALRARELRYNITRIYCIILLFLYMF